MKFQRPGFTESTLLYIKYIEDNHNNLLDSQQKIVLYSKFANWLYTTSGFYDKSIRGSYFDYDIHHILESECFNNFLNTYKIAIHNCDKLNIFIHAAIKNNIPQDIFDQFIISLSANQISEFWFNYQKWYDILENKSVLLISSFAPLMVNQYESGNLHRIDNKFPNLRNIFGYRTPYTFFNNGNHTNFFETLEDIITNIKKIQFDIAIIGCGAYGCLIAESISSENRLGISIGSRVSQMFGVDPDMRNNNLWISSIPKEYIPQNYQKIEGGRYWFGRTRE